MKPEDLYNKIKSATYTTSGIDVDWTIKVTEDSVMLLFEESKGTQDWKTNFNFPASLYKQQKNVFLVHGGYGKAYKSCNDDIMHVFIAARDANPTLKAVVSGWSYGGAMAVLAGEDYCYRTGEKPELITFGAPKVLFGLFTKRHFNKCFLSAKQYAHVNDCVPLLPPFVGFTQLKKVKVGTGFRPWRLFKPTVYHCGYGDSNLY